MLVGVAGPLAFDWKPLFPPAPPLAWAKKGAFSMSDVTVSIPITMYHRIKWNAHLEGIPIDEFIANAVAREIKILPARVHVWKATLVHRSRVYPLSEDDKRFCERVKEVIDGRVPYRITKFKEPWSSDELDEFYDPNEYLAVELETHNPKVLLDVVDELNDLDFSVMPIQEEVEEITPPALWPEDEQRRWIDHNGYGIPPKEG